MLDEAAARGFYGPLFYRDLIGDPTGLSLPMFMEELFWGCAGIGLTIVMPALALSAIGQAASPEQMLQWAPECFGEPGDGGRLRADPAHGRRPSARNRQIDAARPLTWRASWMAATGVSFDLARDRCRSRPPARWRSPPPNAQFRRWVAGPYQGPPEKWNRDAKLYTIFEGTSEIQRIVISHALGTGDGAPPLHIDLEPTGGPLNRLFGRALRRGPGRRTRRCRCGIGFRSR